MPEPGLRFPPTTIHRTIPGVSIPTTYSRRLEEDLPRIRDRIAEAAARSGRTTASVRLVAVTKGHPLEAVLAARDAGLVDVGENRLGELERKRAALDDAGDAEGLHWHMIGHVQSRKAPRARELAGTLHSLDSLKLARRLERTAPEGGRPLDVMVQVNTSGEASKHGFSPAGFLDAVPEIVALSSLRVVGLMTMAPLTDDREHIRGAFRRLRELNVDAVETVPGYRGTELSMGMSNDYELAVEEGSTLIRLGTALFGERPQ